MNDLDRAEQAAINEIESEKSANWSGWFGELYFSKSDSRWFLRRRNLWMGWAVNLAHPWGVIYLYASLMMVMFVGFALGLGTMALVAMSWQ